MSFNGKEFGWKSCPKCGEDELDGGAFSICADCYVECVNCGFIIESEVSWDGCDSIQEHDDKCLEHLKQLWNNYDEKTS